MFFGEQVLKHLGSDPQMCLGHESAEWYSRTTGFTTKRSKTYSFLGKFL